MKYLFFVVERSHLILKVILRTTLELRTIIKGIHKKQKWIIA